MLPHKWRARVESERTVFATRYVHRLQNLQEFRKDRSEEFRSRIVSTGRPSNVVRKEILAQDKS